MRDTMGKSRLRGVLCLLLALSLLCALLPAERLTAEAAPEQYTVSDYHFMARGKPGDETSLNGADTAGCFVWSDSWFFTDGETFNAHLSALSAAAALASVGYLGDDADGSAQRDRNVKEFLRAMGFEDVESNAWYTQESRENSAACAVAHKTITDGGRSATLLAVLPCCANYGQEWAGNFNLGSEGLHAGFKAGRDETLRFVKQYLSAHGISGAVKVWTAGHSRGAAIANLLGAFFAEDGAGYFSGVRFSAKDIYCYCFGTPGNTVAGVTRAQALSVAGSRGGDYAFDTPGEPYAYSGADAGARLDPHSVAYACVHSCSERVDLLSQLPPAQWGFTTFGTGFAFGSDAAHRERMLVHLRTETPDVYKAFSEEAVVAGVISTGANGDPGDYAWKRFSRSSLSFEDDGALAMEDMIASRVGALCALAHSRAEYSETWQATFAAALAVFGMAGEDFTAQLGADELWTLLVNYAAYASGRIGGEDADVEAVTGMLLGLHQYLNGEALDRRETTLRDGLETLLTDVGGNETLLALLQHLERSGALPEALTEAVKTVTKGGSLSELAAQCASGDAEKAAEAVQSAFDVVLELTPEGVRELSGQDEEPVRLRAAVRAVLSRALGGDENGPVTLEQAADELLTRKSEALKTATLNRYTRHASEASGQQLSAHFDTLIGHPRQLRDILMNLLCRTGEQYSFPEELRTAVTLLAQADKIAVAHYSERYLASARADDSAWVLGDLPSGAYDTALTLKLCSAAAQLRYTTDGSVPTASSPLYTDSGIALPAGGSADGTYIVRALPFENGASVGPVWDIGVYSLLVKPVITALSDTAVTVAAAAGQEYVLAAKGDAPDWTRAVAPTDGSVRFTGLESTKVYTVYTRVAGADNGAAEKTEFAASLRSLSADGELLIGAVVRLTALPAAEGLKYRWYRTEAPEEGSEPDLSAGQRVYTANGSAYLLTALDLGRLLYAKAYIGEHEVGCVPVGVAEYGSVEFQSNGGSAVERATGLVRGGRIRRPADPVRSGYRFGGWYADEALTTPWYFLTDTVRSVHTTLYADWIPEPEDDSASWLPGTAAASSVTFTAEQIAGAIASGSPALEARLADCVVGVDARALNAAAPGQSVTVTVRGSAADSLRFELTAGGKAVDAELKVSMPARADGDVLTQLFSNGTCAVVKKSLLEDGRARALLPAGAAVVVENRALRFPDVAAGAWYADAVGFVSGHELFQGTDRGFEPDTVMSRAMLATVLYRLEDASAAGESPFADVPSGKWYTGPVIWASGAGIVRGTPKGFEPDAIVTREQIAVMLLRYAEYLGLNTGARAALNGFADAALVSHWARDAMQWAVGAGLLRGDAGGRLNPLSGASRAEVAALLQRMVGLIVR